MLCCFVKILIDAKFCSDPIPVGAPTKIHLEHRNIAVEEFLEMLRFDQRDKIAELPSELLRECSG